MCRLFAEYAVLAVDVVVGGVFLPYRQEGVQPDVQGDEQALRTQVGYLLQQLRGEVQPGGGRGRAAGVVGVHRLVALRVLYRVVDVGGQRRLPQPA